MAINERKPLLIRIPGEITPNELPITASAVGYDFVQGNYIYYATGSDSWVTAPPNGGAPGSEYFYSVTNTIIQASGSLYVSGAFRALSLSASNGGTITGSLNQGRSTIASGLASHAEGYITLAPGSYSHAEGWGSTADGFGTHAEGDGTSAAYTGSHAEGHWTIAVGDYSHAEGEATIASGYSSHAEGAGDSNNYGAFGMYSHSEGLWTKAIGNYSHAEGFGTTALNESDHAEGYGTEANGGYSHAEGGGTIATGSYSHAEGLNTKSGGFASHSEGDAARSEGDYSHTEGYATIAYGMGSHSEGEGSKAGLGSYAIRNPGTGIPDLTASPGNAVYCIDDPGTNLTSEFPVYTNGRLFIGGIGPYLCVGSNYVSTFPGYTYVTASDTSSLTPIGYYPSSPKFIAITFISNPGAVELQYHAGIALGVSVSAHAEGERTIAIGSYTHAEGLTTIAVGKYSHAEGADTLTLGTGSHSEGSGSQAVGKYSHTEGYKTIASGSYSHAEGDFTLALGDYSHAEGSGSKSTGKYSHAEGAYALANGLGAHAEGLFTTASNNFSHAEGNSTIASGENSHSEGRYNIASGKASHAEGNFTTGSGEYSHAEGRNTLASGRASHTEGYYTTGSGENSHAEGQYTITYGTGSHAEGYNTIASGNHSHTEGYFTTGSGQYSHAEGYYTTTIGEASHAEGWYTTASGSQSHAEGRETVASGSQSHAEGRETVALGDYSHAEGEKTQALQVATHAEGYSTVAGLLPYGASYSHAEGGYTLAGAAYSHAEGYFTTTSLGSYSHAEGHGSIAVGQGSHAEGWYTIASGNYQHVQGQYNLRDNNFSIFVIGDGTGSLNSERSDIVRVNPGLTPGFGRFEVTGTVKSTLGFSGSLTKLTDGTDYLIAGKGLQITSNSNGSVTIQQSGAESEVYWSSNAVEKIYTTASLTQMKQLSASNGAIITGSVVQGLSNIASGLFSFAQGNSTVAFGDYSHAEGKGTIASGSHQHVQGQYNLRNNNFSQFVIGDGTGSLDSERSDIVRVNSGLTPGFGRFEVTGTVVATRGLSGSLTKLVDGTSYLIAAAGINISSESNGAVTISSTGGGSGQWNELSPGSRLNTTASVAIAGGRGSAFAAQSAGSDVFFYVSGTISTGSLLPANSTNKAVFGGDTVVSGSLFAVQHDRQMITLPASPNFNSNSTSYIDLTNLSGSTKDLGNVTGSYVVSYSILNQYLGNSSIHHTRLMIDGVAKNETERRVSGGTNDYATTAGSWVFDIPPGKVIKVQVRIGPTGFNSIIYSGSLVIDGVRKENVR